MLLISTNSYEIQELVSYRILFTRDGWKGESEKTKMAWPEKAQWDELKRCINIKQKPEKEKK